MIRYTQNHHIFPIIMLIFLFFNYITMSKIVYLLTISVILYRLINCRLVNYSALATLICVLTKLLQAGII